MIILQIALFAVLLGTGAKESVRWTLARNSMDDEGQRAYLFLVDNYLMGVKSCDGFDCSSDPKLGLTAWEHLYSGMSFNFLKEMQSGQSFPLFPADVMETMCDCTMCAVTVMSDIFCVVVVICLQVLLYILIIITVEFLPILLVSVLLLPSLIPITKFKRRKYEVETKNVKLIINLETPKMEFIACYPQVPAERYFGIPVQPSTFQPRKKSTKHTSSPAGSGMNILTHTSHSVELRQDDVKQALDETHGTMFHMYPHRPGRGRRGVLGMASRGSVIIRQPRNFVR